jgi:hypothetical protein
VNFTALFGAFAFAAVLALATAAETPAPVGWILAGSAPTSYEIGTAPDGGRNRGPAGFLRSREAPPQKNGFGTLMQMFKADDYRGKRVRFSASVKTEKVANWAGLWMRVDGPQREILAFDNMQARPIKGTTDWQRQEVVLDVAPAANAIGIGILVNGIGEAWLDDVRFEIVPATIATTAAAGAAFERAPSRP